MAPGLFFPRLAIVGLLIFSLLGCGPSREQLRKEAEDSRKIGEAYLNAGNPTAALKEFLKAEKHDPDSYFLQNDFGLAYLAKNRVDQAIPHFEKAVELKPDYAPGKNNLGYAYLRAEQYDKAVEIFTEVSEDLLYATPHHPLSGLGTAYYHKGQFDLAQKYYLKALEINPRYPSALWGLGRSQIAMGNIAGGTESLERVVALVPNFTEAWFDLGQAYRQSGEEDKAITAFEKVQTLAPDSAMAGSAGKELKALGR